MARQRVYCRLCGAAGGLLLGLPNIWGDFAPAQTIALVPVLCLCASRRFRSRDVLATGMYMGLAYALPQMIILRLPVPMTAILLIWVTVILMAFCWAANWLLRSGSLAGTLATGLLFAVLDWVNFTALPLWGTAQSFARPWSSYPAAIQFVSLTGITGIDFMLGTLQAILAVGLVRPATWRTGILSGTVLLAMCVGANTWLWSRPPLDKIMVAAVGWTNEELLEGGEVYSTKGFETFFARPAAEAAARGARLFVTPELAFSLAEDERNDWIGKLGTFAREHNIALAVGYWNVGDNTNRVMFISAAGELLGEYAKTYLTIFEDFKSGEGKLCVVDVNGIAAGAMICQDDNFADLSRRYSKRGVGLIVVPTLDWPQVKDAHLQNSIYRAIESRYRVVRASADGISAIVSGRGEVLVRRDHVAAGWGIISAELPVYAGGTLFSMLGHWPILPFSLFLVLYGLHRVRMKRYGHLFEFGK